jgi:hypothetical protein
LESNGSNEIAITEFLKGCFGVTEYPEDLSNVELGIVGEQTETIKFSYKRRENKQNNTKCAYANVPDINTEIGIRPADNEIWIGSIAEGILFNPYYTLKLTRNLKPGKNSKICLYLKTTK